VARIVRPELVVLGCVLGLAGLAWLDLLLHGHAMCAWRAEPWRWADLAMATAMWAVMMVAMMLPSAAPMTMTLARLDRRGRARGGAGVPVPLFVAGYVLVWTGWSALAAALQWALQSTLLLSPHLTLDAAAPAGGVLITAGLYQLTPLKSACLARCQSPMGFLLTRWRAGRGGAMVMGLQHGAYCVGCCWALMAVLFVVGAMNLAWVAGLTGYVLLEKIVPGAVPSRIVGLGLVGWGVLVLLA
jgi:predicted metal-binding membrane protein